MEEFMAMFGEWILEKLNWQVKGVHGEPGDYGDNPMINMPDAEIGDTFLLIPLRRPR